MARSADAILASPSLLPIAIILFLHIPLAFFFFPTFFASGNVFSVGHDFGILLPAVIGMQVLLLLGRFDLSIGAQASLAGMVFASLLLDFRLGIALALLGGMLTLALFGFLNGILVGILRLESLIVTLATMGFASSLALNVNGGAILTGVRNLLGGYGSDAFWGAPQTFATSVFLTVLLAFGMKYIRPLYYIRCVGSNAIAAANSGIRTGYVFILAFAIASCGAALTGLFHTVRIGSASPLVFSTLPLEAIAACVIGGASLSGGRGSIFGAAAGLAVILATQNLVALAEISVYWKHLAVGAMLLSAAIFNTFRAPLQHWVRRMLISHSS
jgi:ribose transport system permease protein